MLENLVQRPDDPIIALAQQARTDPSPNTVDLSAGVYKNSAGDTPIIDAVQRAEPRRLRAESTRSYQGILGDERFNRAIEKLILGDHPALRDGRVSTLQTVAGSAAVMIGGQLVAAAQEQPVIWAGKPTWANHHPLLKTAGVSIEEYPFYDYERHEIDFDAMVNALSQIPSKSVVLLHGCCHNPSGADFTQDQWRQLTALFAERGLVPFIDVAYHGFGNGLDEDAFGWRLMAETLPETIISFSCSKIFGLYRDRIGALLVVSSSPEEQKKTLSNLMSLSRATYSMPPAHGAFLVAEILDDPVLRQSWEKDLTDMRERINSMRALFSSQMSEKLGDDRFNFVQGEYGMFSFLGISPDQVNSLREQHSVYMLGSSRISVAGLTEANMGWVTDSLVQVLAG